MTAGMRPPRRVLLIEDDADDAALISLLLEPRAAEAPEFELRLADRLAAGCRLLAREPFDAVLLDLMLPGGVGIEAFQKVREVRPETPIVVLTGIRDEALALEAVSLGAQDFLIKGTVDERLLRRSIRYAIERARLSARFEQALAKDVDGKAVVDAGGVVRYANPAALQLLGRRPGELLGKPWPLPLPAPGALLESSAGAPGRLSLLELRGAELEWEGAPARLLALRDVSALRRAETLERESRERLLAAELKGELIANISHELRNPLTTVKTAVQSLREELVGPLNVQQRRFVELAHRNVERQIRIISNALELSRLQSGRAEIARRPVDAAALIDEALLGYTLSRSGPRVEAAVSGGLPPLSGDPDLVTQVIVNLVDNAVHFARERVIVKATEERGELLISVIDDGPGLAEGQAERLFTRFAQGARGAIAHRGAGLGLSICKEIVAAHGGRIWAESVRGRGARFHTAWPAHKVPAAPAAGSSS